VAIFIIIYIDYLERPLRKDFTFSCRILNLLDATFRII